MSITVGQRASRSLTLTAEHVRKFAEKCPGRPLSLEIIVTGPRYFNYRDPKFWDAYRSTPAWEFARFLVLADKGTARTAPPQVSREAAAARELEDVEASDDTPVAP